MDATSIIALLTALALFGGLAKFLMGWERRLTRIEGLVEQVAEANGITVPGAR